jgi:sugar phosphate isomerase/epimerase
MVRSGAAQQQAIGNLRGRKEIILMLIGGMNHPARGPIEEIRWMAQMQLEFVDLTLEPPSAATWMVDIERICDTLAAYGLKVVGHTAYYLSIGSPFESVRLAAVAEIGRCIEAFGRIGAAWVNIHPDGYAPLHDWSYVIERNLKSLHELQQRATDAGVGIMIENLPRKFNSPAELAPLLNAMPELGLHLDIGHANLLVEENTTEQILSSFGSRLRHVHLHDNKGGDADLHLPLGAGNVDLYRAIRAVQRTGYDGTITLEVFTPDKHHLEYSRDVLRAIWNEVAAETRSAKAA